MVEAYAETWTEGLGIDGYTEDISANYGCMLQTGGKGGLPFWHDIIARVRQRQPQVVQSGARTSWEEMIEANANIGGRRPAPPHSLHQ